MKNGLKKYKPGDHPEDYRYLFEGHSHLITEFEAKAWRNILIKTKSAGTDKKKMAQMMETKWFHREPEVLSLLGNGVAAFCQKTIARVLIENPNGLNTCPKCGSLCRTSKACLCPQCAHTWFEKRIKAEQRH